MGRHGTKLKSFKVISAAAPAYADRENMMLPLLW